MTNRMIAVHRPVHYSEASLTCRDALGAELVASSSTSGWTSLLLERHRLSESASRTFDTHPTADQTIVVMLSGEQDIDVYRNGAWRPARYRAGTIGMTPGGASDRIRRRICGGRPAEKLNLYVPRSVFAETKERYRMAGQRSVDDPMTALAFEDPLVAGTVRALSDAMRLGATDLYAETAAYWLAAHLLSEHGSWSRTSPERRAEVMAAGRFARVLDLMTERFAENLTLDALAREAGVSKFHFARMFRSRTGQSPHAFLVSLRMDKACRLLVDTDLQIADVARRCGYGSAAHFAAVYGRRFGMTPNATRHRQSAKK